MAPAVGFRLANLKADCQFNPQLCSNHVGSNWKTCHAVTVPYLKFSRRNRFLSIKPYPICLQNELRRVGSFRASVNTGTKNCRTFEILASKKELDTQFRTNESSDTESEKPEVKVLRTFVEVSEESVETETAKQNTGSGVLKINLDLLLYRCRRLRHEAYYVRDKRERAKMYQQLEAGLKDAIRMDPKDGRAYVSLGKHYLQQKRFEDAYRTYEDGCAATEGQNPYIWQAWATLEAKRGNASHARKLYNAATVASESHVTAWHGWGQLEKQQGNYVRARELWIKGLQRAAKPNEYLYQSLGLLAEELGRIDEARMWFRQGTDRLKGVSAHAIWQAWALMEAKHGDPMTVRLLFRKGLKANPKSRYIYLSWGDWEKRMGNLDQARKILAKGNEVNPADPAIYQALGLVEESLGNVEMARHIFSEGLEVDPSHVYLWQAWGVLEWRQGNVEEARRLFQKGIWADPKSKDVCTVFQAWGCVERDSGNVSLARSLLKCAVKADQNSEASWMAWAQLEENLGFLERANEIRNCSMQERTVIAVPPPTSAELQQGSDQDSEIEGLSSSSFSQAVQQISKWNELMRNAPRKLPKLLKLNKDSG